MGQVDLVTSELTCLFREHEEGSKGRRRQDEEEDGEAEADIILEGIRGGLQRKWPQCDPLFLHPTRL